MAIAKNSGKGDNLENRVMNRRRFLKTTGGVVVGAVLSGCAPGDRRPVLMQTVPEGQGVVDPNQTLSKDPNEPAGIEAAVKKEEEKYKPLTEMQDMFQYDIMHYSEVSASDNDQISKLAENADYIRRAYTSKQFKGKEKDRLGLLALRYTNLVACSLVRDIPTVTDSSNLKSIVRLNIAETITSNGAARKSIEKKRKSYEKAYGKIDKSSGSEYDKIKDQILVQYKLKQQYKECKDFGKGLVKFADGIFVDPFRDLFYGFGHMDLPPTPGKEKDMAERNMRKASKHVEEMIKEYDGLRAEHESSLVDFLKGSRIGTEQEVKDRRESGKRAYHFKLDVGVVEDEVTKYNNSLAEEHLRYNGKKMNKLEYGRKINTLINLALGKDKRIYTKAQRAQLAMAGSRLKTGLSWKEKVEADRSYAEFESSGGQKDLARAASHALAAYVLSCDLYDQSVFRGMLDDYKSQMKKLKVSKETRREANVEVLFPYYLDELNERKRKAFWTSVSGGGRIGLAAYFLLTGGAGGAGAGAGGGSFSVAGGFI